MTAAPIDPHHPDDDQPTPEEQAVLTPLIKTALARHLLDRAEGPS